MNRISFYFLWTILLTFRAAECKLQLQCYLASWSLNNGEANAFRVPDILPSSGCDIIIYAFFNLANNRLEPPSGNRYRGHFQQLGDLKLRNPFIKVYLSVGGWSLSKNFSSMAASAVNRATFITGTVADLRKWGLDGLDIDWEFPEAHDKDNFVTLLKELRFAFEDDARITGRNRLGLSAAVANSVLPGYNVSEMGRYLDVINVMSYDYHTFLNGSDTNIGYSAAIADVRHSISEWIQAGAPPSSLSMGIPFFAHSWTLANLSTTENWGAAAVDRGLPGTISQESGALLYIEVCPSRNPGWTFGYNEKDQVTYAKKHDQWIDIDDIKTIKNKVSMAAKENLHGVFVWHLGQDDISGKCGEGKFPLLNAVVQEMCGTTTTSQSSTTLSTTTLSTSTATLPIITSTIRVANLTSTLTRLNTTQSATQTSCPTKTASGTRSYAPAQLVAFMIFVFAVHLS